MSLSFFDFTAEDVVLWEGDSKSDKSLQYQMLRCFMDQGDAAFRRRTAASGGAGSPVWVNKATNGATIATIAARIAGELALNAYTKIVLCIGTNQRAVSRAQTLIDLAALIAAIGGVNAIDTLVFTDYAWGEKYPSGQNVHAGANDTRLDETATDITSTFGAGVPNSMVVNLRTGLGSRTTSGMYTDIMPPLNLPAPGVTSGPFTAPDTSGAHDNARSRARIFDLCGSFVRFRP